MTSWICANCGPIRAIEVGVHWRVAENGEVGYVLRHHRPIDGLAVTAVCEEVEWGTFVDAETTNRGDT